MSGEIIRRRRRGRANIFPIQPFFEKTTVEDTYKWPLPGKNDSITFANPNTQRSQVECHLSPNKLRNIMLTTYENDYIRPKKFPPHISKKALTIYTKKPADFHFETATTAYKEMTLPLMNAIRRNRTVYVTPVRAPRALREPYKLKCSSEYKSSFSPKKIEMEAAAAAAAKSPPPGGVRFKGESTMRADYTNKKVLLRTPSPKEKRTLSPETRDFCTTYRLTHKKIRCPAYSSIPSCIRILTRKRN